MIVVFGVALFALARPLVAGFAGSYFLPPVLAEATHVTAPFAALALLAALLERAPARAARMSHVLAVMLPWAGLFVLQGQAWIELHTPLAEVLGSGRALSLVLLACGACAGMAIVGLEHRASRPAAQALLVAVAGWLILGPEIYQRFDHIELRARVLAALGVAALFAALAGVLLAFVRSRRPRSLSIWIGGAIALLIALAALMPGPRQLEPRAPIVLVVVDTLRADQPDRKTAAGEPLMPRFQEISRSGVRYAQAIAPSPWTLPSVVSVLSAMNPYRHHVGRMQGYVALPGDNAAAGWLGSALRDVGYQPAGFVNNPWLRPYYRFGQGFVCWRRYRGDAHVGVDAALDWIDVHHSRPFFVLLHLMDPHWPYDAPAGFGEPRQPCSACSDLRALQYTPTGADVREEVRRRYDAETAFTDHELGRFWDELRSRGVLDDAWLIVTSDHGEEFWDHLRFLHGHTLYDELLRVPLLVVPPLRHTDAPRGVTVATQVRLEDVGATIADLAGARAPTPVDGLSLLAERELWGDVGKISFLPALAQQDPARLRPVVAGFLQEDGRRDWAVRAGGLKYVRTADAPLPLLFDLIADPYERATVNKPLAALGLAALPDELGFKVERGQLRAPPSNTAGVSGQLERELRSLGYVH